MPTLISYKDPVMRQGFPLYQKVMEPLTRALETHPVSGNRTWAYPSSADTAYANYRGATIEGPGLITFQTAVDERDARGQWGSADGFFVVKDTFRIDCAHQEIRTWTVVNEVGGHEVPSWLVQGAENRLVSPDGMPAPDLVSFARNAVIPLARAQGWDCEASHAEFQVRWDKKPSQEEALAIPDPANGISNVPNAREDRATALSEEVTRLKEQGHLRDCLLGATLVYAITAASRKKTPSEIANALLLAYAVGVGGFLMAPYLAEGTIHPSRPLSEESFFKGLIVALPALANNAIVHLISTPVYRWIKQSELSRKDEVALRFSQVTEALTTGLFTYWTFSLQDKSGLEFAGLSALTGLALMFPMTQIMEKLNGSSSVRRPFAMQMLRSLVRLVNWTTTNMIGVIGATHGKILDLAKKVGGIVGVNALLSRFVLPFFLRRMTLPAPTPPKQI